MSTQKNIADAMVTALAALSGAPSIVEYRKKDGLYPEEGNSAIILTAGFQRPTGYVFGDGVTKGYGYQISVYRESQGETTSNIDVNPTLVELAKRALDATSLSGVSTVWSVDIVDDPEAWERQPFRDGCEVSRFGVLVKTCEPRNG